MATLVSPGVDVQIINESFYANAGNGTIPLFVIATASNKATPSGIGVAPSTVASEAGKLFLATSQRELTQSFGNPIFHSSGGTPLHGHELNEYGLHAAHSYLGVSNRAYILRADVDLAALESSDSSPRGAAVSGTFWFDTQTTDFGLFVSNGNANPGLAWDHTSVKTPAGDDLTGSAPSVGYGSDGDFAFVAADASLNAVNKFFEKVSGAWEEVGSASWITAKGNSPTAVMTNDAQYPAGGVAGSIWIKLSAPNMGAEWMVKRYNAATAQWVISPAPFFADDNAATANGINATGQIYVQFNNGTLAMTLRRFNGTAFEDLVYEAGLEAPSTAPVDGTVWFNNDTVVDILVNQSGTDWVGRLTEYPNTDPAGVIVAGSAPTAQSDDTPLVDNDLWLDASDLENYPRLYRYNATTLRWDAIDNTDQTTPFGIVFADARETADLSSTGTDLDPDAPDATAYPAGTLLMNMRVSTGNVKVYRPNWFNAGGYDANTDYVADGDVTSAARWVSASGNREDGAPHMMRKAQRAMVVRAMAEAVAANEDIRSEVVFFNIMAAPGYPELTDELITLNVDQKETAFICMDTPARLAPKGMDIQDWATNANNAAGNGEDGLTSASPYVGVFYPWGLSTNVDGQSVMVPASTIAMRTLAYNDSVAYPWMAPAGTQRGLVNNATAVGYLTSEDEFRAVTLNEGQRDVLYTNKINPIAYMPGTGLMIYGQKTLDGAASALDRINVARLINYLRVQLDGAMKPFLFQPNDNQTRDSARLTVERLLVGLVGLRALTDFAVICSEQNNTPERVDRNELWVDVLIKPTKAVEFIYVPVRIRDSGSSLDY